MIIPIRCFTCGNVVADKWKPFVEGIIKKKELSSKDVSSNLDIQYIEVSKVDGFYAHELAEVVPEAVTGEKDALDWEGKPDYQAIDQAKIVPLLTAALQQAIDKIEALELRINKLEKQ